MDSEQIQKWIQNINLYLEGKQRADRLWEQIDLHLHTSYLAESVGDTALVPKHLQAVALLLLQANDAQKQVQQLLHTPL